jgi:ketosteroid isomerase-like protein
MFAAGDSGDVDGLLGFLTDDVVLVFGNGEPVHKDGIRDLWGQVVSTLKGVRHEIHDIWHAAEDADVLIARMTVHYSKLDGSVVSLPCVNVFRLRDELIADYRIYIDASPVFA